MVTPDRGLFVLSETLPNSTAARVGTIVPGAIPVRMGSSPE